MHAVFKFKVEYAAALPPVRKYSYPRRHCGRDGRGDMFRFAQFLVFQNLLGNISAPAAIGDVSGTSNDSIMKTSRVQRR